MPRTTTASTLDRRINDIVTRAAQEIAQTVRQSILDEVNQLVSGRANVAIEGGMARKRRVITCPVPGCGKPGGGPKWGWFCAEHKDLPSSEKEKARAARNAEKPGAAPVAPPPAAPKAGRKKK